MSAALSLTSVLFGRHPSVPLTLSQTQAYNSALGLNVLNITVKSELRMTQSREQIQNLIMAHSERLYRLKMQAARYGINVDPGIQIEIEDIEAKIKQLQLSFSSVSSNIEFTRFATELDFLGSRVETVADRLGINIEKISGVVIGNENIVGTGNKVQKFNFRGCAILAIPIFCIVISISARMIFGPNISFDSLVTAIAEYLPTTTESVTDFTPTPTNVLPLTITCITSTGESNLNVRSGPGLNFMLLTSLPNGTTVKALVKNPGGDWIKIQTQNVLGWVKIDFIDCDPSLSNLPEETSTVEPSPPKTPSQAVSPTAPSPVDPQPVIISISNLQRGGKDYTLNIQNNSNQFIEAGLADLTIADDLGNPYETDCLEVLKRGTGCNRKTVFPNSNLKLDGVLEVPINSNAGSVKILLLFLSGNNTYGVTLQHTIP